jgi:NRPS condensation-like uncharacterized protein
MNRSSSSTSSKVVQIDNEDSEELVTINEKVNLTKNQHEVLQMVCNFYEIKHLSLLPLSFKQVFSMI